MMMSVVAAASWEKDVYVSSNAEVLSTTDVRLDDSTEAKEPETLKEVLIDYTQRTTLHGYAYITTPTPYLSRRIFWAIYICCTSLFFLYYTSSQLQQFLLFEKSSLIEVHFRTAVKFPAVTLCNLNRFRFTPSIEHGWYETASFISNNSVNKTIKFRNCTDDEVMCIEDGACIKKDRICDGFPDCKERSDEEGCDRCQLIYLDDQGKNASVAFNKQYVYYGLLYKDNRDLYISEEPPFIYLYRAGDTWYLANDLHPAATIYAKVSSNEERPEGLGLATWSVNKSSLDVGSDDVEVLAYCDINFAWLLEDTSKPVDMKLDMFTLYNETGHRLEDLLRTCLWKGVPCEEVGNITAVMTNLGLCYTITFKESTIEHAGVGYGLSMVFNIELYEYLSTTKLGIKLLLHEPNIFPNMLDDGLSITPGLVSYIAVEATQVDNLPAPWGTCGELPINYYDVYSISRCYVACETKLLEEDCGCRAFYMPHEDGEPEVCDVQTYLDCAVPALETIRVNSHANYCQECTEPCHKDVFVTSTSFALMMAEFGGEQDLRRYTLSQKLFAAREARFRYIKENYKETMRQFDLMDQRLAQLRKLLDLLAWRMNEDYADITAYSMLVNGDCKTSRDMLTAVRQIIDIEMIKQLEEFRARLLNLLAKQFPHVLSLTEGLTEVIENARAEYGLGTDPLIMDFGTCKADCRTTLEGYDYDGNRSTTVSGFTCQRWDSQIPHQHPYTATYDDRFPEGNIVDASNFCRNPNKEPTGPWCYTTNPDVEREACLVPICSDCRNVGETYRGNRRLTLSGRTCQRWDSQSPHPHDYNDPDYFPDDSLSAASNFCRNPDNKPTGPWCYTTDPEMTWETCAIPLCHDCKMKSLGTDYVGTKAVTRTGRPCQRWDMQYPHNHTFTNTSYFPDHTLADASNFCRNPDFKDIGPWCFTTDPNRIWEPCGIPFCSKCKLHSDEKGQLYDGTQSFTIFGRACQRWDSQTPHSHPYTSDEMFVDGSVSAASNYCRNPDPTTHSAPWCYTTHPDFEWEPCDISLCNDCLETSLGLKYNGNKAITSSNRPCQRWDSQFPHQHPYKDAINFVDSSLFEANNFCRNPDSNESGPWCYTTDPEVEREYCNIPKCSSCRMDDWGRAYKGLANTTKSGLSCQRWDSQSPHSHESFPMDHFPDGTLEEAANYCRNPDLRLGVGPWCYTTDLATVWEECDVPSCVVDLSAEGLLEGCTDTTPACEGSCAHKICSEPDCRITEVGSEYRGKRSFTVSGYRCQRWDAQEPHPHPFTDPALFPEDALGDNENYCRNPDSRIGTGPWCYTTDPNVEWEPCGVTRCSECKSTVQGLDYVGKQTVTSSGLVCQPWAYQYPHEHTFTNDSMFPDRSVDAASHFCRNPDGKPDGPWCYTLDPDVEWETCGIVDCQGEDQVGCRRSYYGDEYKGTKSWTLSGRRCQRWDVQSPNTHSFTSSDFPDNDISDAADYCRNPDRRSGDGPWCFTTDPDVPWEFCGVPFCYETEILTTKEGLEYTGVRSLTMSGIPCQDWKVHKPHPHPFFDPSPFPEGSLAAVSNYCRNPDNRPTGPWCYTVDPEIVWETCGIVTAAECRVTDKGTEYTGNQSRTISGRLCQRWDAQWPHDPGYTDAADFPDYSLQDAANFCRNPTDSATGPWCYTTDPDMEKEACYVPKCDDCKKTYLGTDYTGSRYFTVSGRICQRWDEQNPHQHTFTDSDFPDDTIQQANNYCRNPDNSLDGPWCYTIDPDVEREPCAIKLCMTPGCRQTELGATYRGHHYLTVSGRLCQRWDKQLPHSHTYTDADFFPDETLADASNYCRNPDNDPDGPWCYTVDPNQIRETCNIPLCSDCVDDPSSSQYTGKRLITSSGRVCQRWDSQSPHSHSTTSADLPDASLEDAANYCRNPDGRSTGPWCYTLDPDLETETCGVPDCAALTSEEAMSTPETTTPTTAPLVSSSSSSSTNASSGIARRCDYYLQRTITRYNESLHKALSKLSLSILNTKKYGANFTDEPRYVINKTLLQPIQSNFGTRCDWCSPTNGTQTVIKSLSERMVEWQQTVAKKVTTDVLEQIQQAVSNYFSQDWVTNLKHAIITEDIGDLQTALRTAINTTKQALTDTNHNWLRVKEASQLTREFIDNTWRLECNSQLSKLLKEYEHFIKTINGVLDHFKVYLDAIRVENKNYLQSYMSNEMSLQNISSSLRFKDLDLQMQAAKITIDTHMTTGQLLVNSLHLHINQIYYTMLTYTDPEFLKSSSIYWNYMNVSWSNVSLPSMRDISGIELPESRYGIEPDQSVADRWQQPVLNIANMRKELEDRMADLDITMNEAKAYFDDYLRGNQIDDEFFEHNLIAVEVFCSDMSERSIGENKLYDYPNLLSDVGGVMGLMMGASVISIGELLDLVIFGIAKKCKRSRQAKENK